MEYRQNADWSEDEHPRDGDGKFAEKNSKSWKWTADAQPKKRQQAKLDKREYAIVDSARKQKFAEYRRSGIPKQDYVFTDGKFIIFANKSRDNFVIRRVLDIETERELINVYIGDLK